MKNGIKRSEAVVFDGCTHAPLYEKVEDFNRITPRFLESVSV